MSVAGHGPRLGDVDLAHLLRRNGRELEDIAAAVGIGRTTVKRWLAMPSRVSGPALPTRIRAFWSLVSTGADDACWLWTGGVDDDGYGKTRFYGKHMRAHQVAILLARGERVPAGRLSRHLCGVRPCCNPNHVVVGTVAENSADMIAMGNSLHGERNVHAKLTRDDVIAMRALRASGAKTTELGERFGVTEGAASKICRGATWKHIGGVA